MTSESNAPGEQPGAAGTGDARLSAPSALRNRDAILDHLPRFAPERGRALEIASGTGEHIVRFAAATPGLTWQPTEPDAARRASITAWAEAESVANILPPLDLDAARPGWGAEIGPVDFLFLSNLLHLISTEAAEAVLTGIAEALRPSGVALIYGPFLRDGEATSEGDAAFDAQLRAQDPAIGYKDVLWVLSHLVDRGLRVIETVRMPANNLLLAVERV
ncbi:class I SAM-dependent methyltransferase [Roseibacterium beibuensis]|uniref:DUF938 domain-containing protein n=1 Tax=[Roseibacterium] beibuensis TaxID=1193142 RepID=A0ABP9KUY0_9RHOB|nr:class I SAM-dependent methyltransferase [Roseibacterium beibuensis]MCS6622384.1 class I SAM-dependent methyltransferase [Roseibacterium beibuensis]